MLLCDRAIREVGTNKVTLVGIFDRISVAAFPTRFVSGMALYARMTDSAGDYPMKLELVRLEDELAIGKLEGMVTITDRMGSSELMVNIPELLFEREGRYDVRLFMGGRFVGSTTLDVQKT